MAACGPMPGMCTYAAEHMSKPFPCTTIRRRCVPWPNAALRKLLRKSRARRSRLSNSPCNACMPEHQMNHGSTWRMCRETVIGDQESKGSLLLMVESIQTARRQHLPGRRQPTQLRCIYLQHPVLLLPRRPNS